MMPRVELLASLKAFYLDEKVMMPTVLNLGSGIGTVRNRQDHHCEVLVQHSYPGWGFVL